MPVAAGGNVARDRKRDSASLASELPSGRLGLQPTTPKQAEPAARPAGKGGSFYKQAVEANAAPWEQVESLSASVAEAAVASGTDLDFLGLKQMSPEIAEILAENPHSLSFPLLTEINQRVAEKLAAHSGGPNNAGLLDDDELALSGLRLLPDAVAFALARRPSGGLVIGSESNPIPSISTKAAEALARSRSRYLSVNVGRISSDGQDALADYRGMLRLPALSQIESAPLLRKLVSNPAGAVLAMTSVTPEQSAIIAESGNMVLLQGVTSIDLETARILSKARAELSLLGLRSCPEDVRAVLARNKNISLP